VNLRAIYSHTSYDNVSDEPVPGSSLSLLALREVRKYIRKSHAVMMTVTFAVLYALGSMVMGGMLVLFSERGGYTVGVLWGNPLGQSPWLYPGLIVSAPWGVLTLPFFGTLSMIIVSIGVGIGMAVAVLLVIALVRNRGSSGRASSVGSAAGLTPTMLALVTLGACCSTTAAATAGVGLVASVSGSNTDNLLLNNWFLGVFQIAIVWVALLAQELVLRVYSGILGLSEPGIRTTYIGPRYSSRFLTGSLLRVALLVGGVTWSLTMLVEWTSTGPFNASAALWFRWIVQHQLPAFLAIMAALFPAGTARALTGAMRATGRGLLRGGLLLAGITLVAGAPPPLAGWGIEGLGNEAMGVLGYSASMGAVTPVFPPGLDLAFRWGLQYLLLGGLAIAVALVPDRAFAPLGWTLGHTVTEVTRAPATDASSPGAPARTTFDREKAPAVDSSAPQGCAAEGP
jgi:hypothetical protein